MKGKGATCQRVSAFVVSGILPCFGKAQQAAFSKIFIGFHNVVLWASA